MHPVSISPPPARPCSFRALVAAGAAPGQAQTAPRPAPRPGSSSAGSIPSQLFHISVVAASRRSGEASPAKLPAGIAKALDDLKDFLPYQSYQVVDSALVRASDELHTRLSGPDGALYQVDAVFSTQDDGKTFLVEQFELRKLARMEDLAREMERSRPGTPAPAPIAPESGLSASFRIDRGEAVVVGSSRLEGADDALIVLLTAVP